MLADKPVKMPVVFHVVPSKLYSIEPEEINPDNVTAPSITPQFVISESVIPVIVGRPEIVSIALPVKVSIEHAPVPTTEIVIVYTP